MQTQIGDPAFLSLSEAGLRDKRARTVLGEGVPSIARASDFPSKVQS